MNVFSFLSPSVPKQPLNQNDNNISQTYKYWRFRILYSTMIGYALFYFVRKNISLAMPVMETDLGISKTELGLFLTLHGILYGVSKFVNGFLGDHLNPRYFMSLGLLLSALMSLFFGLSSTVIAFGIFWLLNGWFQGMGFPPCAHSLTSWFHPSERGRKFSIWNTSHSIGAGLVLLLNSFLVLYNWRYCFIVPAFIAILGAFFLLNRLRDTPESLGLPPVKGEKTFEERNFKSFLLKNVFSNPAIWIISLANFFLYTVRYAILDWGPTFLTEMKGTELQHAGWIVAGYEAMGIAGMLVSGWMMDKVFKGHGGRACSIYMFACTIFILLFWKLPIQSAGLNALLLCAIGFFIYGPQCLVGVIAANLATKRAAATAIGLTGLFGYLSGILSGWGLGLAVEKSGWDAGFLILVLSGLLATILFTLVWKAK